MASAAKNNWVLLIVLLLIGFICGSILGEILRPYFPLIAKGATAEIDPQTFKLANAFSLTFGFKIHLNLATILGVVFAFIVYRRL
ncbi:MAG TPA: DUF4321 domain-containing protein [Bacillota bacterium]|jgi:hypothetical protein|nr:DUF4321 domain-containing protein [Bacillota bacterium]HOL09360.1 DUF4321 domain-containing protein [Bacillota bacterium]HPO97091.1 DUF4321 domain-containing protein [Bacillota bacterium]